jgi:tRNA (guanine-N7-)-methyltransferase
MPHIKVQSMSNETLHRLQHGCETVRFFAEDPAHHEAIIGIEQEGEVFGLLLKRFGDYDLLKFDKITRPPKVSLVKKALATLAASLELKILHGNIADSSTRPPLSSSALKTIRDFEDRVFDTDEIAIEVGFGSGRHLLYQARQNPDCLYIGIEIHTPSAQQVLKQIELQKLKNIWVLNYDARLFLEMMPSNSCRQIFVHFPVPWDKKPHRRVISPAFVEESMRVLRQDGTLELRTDSERYFRYAVETFCSIPRADMHLRKNAEIEITSKYEARWKRQEKNIYDLYLRALEHSEPKPLQVDFSFGALRYTARLEQRLSLQAMVGADYFVHFERIFKIDADEGLLIRVAFGGFDRPEHKYVMIDSEGCRYYVSDPVKTTVNDRAHQKIMESLNG